MLIFAKDITERDHKHSQEENNTELQQYMEYQRKLFPYTVVRAGLDLAYKELDDILVYLDNDSQPPQDSSRQDYPEDCNVWYRERFPWASAFIKMEDMHFVLVTLVKAMDSFRTHEPVNSYHLAVLYDAVHNIVNVYNNLLENENSGARDIHLSSGVAVAFDDFINNYWPNLDFMILSKPDYPHPRHMERNTAIEEKIKQQMAEGDDPLTALEKIAPEFAIDESTLAMIKRLDTPTRFLDLVSRPQEAGLYDPLKKLSPADSPHAGLTVLDAEYQKNFALDS